MQLINVRRLNNIFGSLVQIVRLKCRVQTSKFKDRPRIHYVRIRFRRSIQHRVRRLVVDVPRHQHFEQLVYQLLLLDPIVRHFHGGLVRVPMPDGFGYQLRTDKTVERVMYEQANRGIRALTLSAYPLVSSASV